MEYYPVEKLKRETKSIFAKYLSLEEYKVFFFGSRVKGDNSPRSDIDIGVLGKHSLEAEVKLDIEEELNRLPTLYKFDVVDFSSVSNVFRQKAMRWVEYVE